MSEFEFYDNETKKYRRFAQRRHEMDTVNPSLLAVFNDSYINEFKLYYALFGQIPSAFTMGGLVLDKAVEFFEKEYQADIQQELFLNFYSRQKKTFITDERMFLLKNGMLVTFNDRDTCRMLGNPPDKEFVHTLTQKLTKFKIREQGTQYKINLLAQSRYEGITTEPLKISRVKLDIKANYNDDFEPIHEIITRRLNQKNDKGLIILHGLPGTGKTSYLRFLTGKIRKKIFFLQPHIAAHITDPEFINILIQNPNSVLIIEDAENILMNREETGNSVVSVLLNLADGLLSDCLNLQIICTFNTAISNIDEALLRKGRLIAKYEFGKLTAEKAAHLSASIGFSNPVSEPMTLAEIYNQQEMHFHNLKEKRKIGF
ncbi:MAG: AAA family ATPase [Spirosomataceae bacterium]